MVITMLEADVNSSRLEELERGYREIVSDLTSDIHETFLVRDRDNGTVCKVITVWTSLEALAQFRDQAIAAGSKPDGVLLFESVGVTPSLAVLQVVERAAHRKLE